MRSYMTHAKLGSLRVWPRVLGVAMGLVGLAASVTGCIIVDDSNDGTYQPTPNPPSEAPRLVDIESDVSLNSAPGEGVGVFVEYYPGGTYRVWATCDTNSSGQTCPIDVYMSVDTSSTIGVVSGDDLEGYDYINLDTSAGTVDLHIETASDVDAIEINTTPGAILRLEAHLDGVPQPRFVYWFGNGVLHEGAPTSPVDFQPTVP